MMKIFKILFPPFSLILLFFILFFSIESFRYFVHYGQKQVLLSTLDKVEDETLLHEINSYFTQYYNQERNKENFNCTHAFYARDIEYAYIYLRCYEEDRGFGAHTRVKLNKNNEILVFTQPIDGEEHGSSLSWIFPKEVIDLIYKNE